MFLVDLECFRSKCNIILKNSYTGIDSPGTLLIILLTCKLRFKIIP